MLDNFTTQAGAYLDHALAPETLPLGLALGLLAFILAHWLRVRREDRSGVKAPPLTVLDLAALFGGGVSASTSASTMYGILTGTPQATQIVGTAAFGAMICLAMILYSRGLLMQARLITLASVITSAATFHAFIGKGEQTALDEATRIREITELRGALAKDLTEAQADQSAARDAIQTTLRAIESGNQRIGDLLAAETEARRAAEAAAVAAEAARASAPAGDPLAPERARVARLRADVDRLQAVADCELHGTARLEGCVGQDGKPVLTAGDGPLWLGARDAANAARAELEPIVAALASAENARAGERGERAQARAAEAATRQAELDGRGAARRAAEEAVTAANASLPALRADAVAKATRADRLRAKLEGLTATGGAWGAQIWAALLLMLVNNPVGQFIGATAEGVKIVGGLLISLLFDLLASLWRAHTRPRKPKLGLIGALRRAWLSLTRGDVAVAALEASAERDWILADQARHAAHMQADIERERTLGMLGEYRQAAASGASDADLAALSARLDAQLARQAPAPTPGGGSTRIGRIAGAAGRGALAAAGGIGSGLTRAAGGVGSGLTRAAGGVGARIGLKRTPPASEAPTPTSQPERQPESDRAARTGLFSIDRLKRRYEAEPGDAPEIEAATDPDELADDDQDAPELQDAAGDDRDAPEPQDTADGGESWTERARRLASELEAAQQADAPAAEEPDADTPLDLAALATDEDADAFAARLREQPTRQAPEDAAAELARRREALRARRDPNRLGLHDFGDEAEAEPAAEPGKALRPFDDYPADYISARPEGVGDGVQERGDAEGSIFDPEQLELVTGGRVGEGVERVTTETMDEKRTRAAIHNGLMRRRPTDLAEGGLVVSNGGFRPTQEMAKNARHYRDVKRLKRLAMIETNRLVGEGMGRNEAAAEAWRRVNAAEQRGQVKGA